MYQAITRGLSPSIHQCALTHLARVPIDFEKACAQHREYETVLRSLGVEILALPAEPRLPDSVFVEDTAVVVDECAVITNPGAESRRAETPAIAAALAPFRKLAQIQPPGQLDGGDVLCVGKRIYIGLSSRSNENAISQMRGWLEPLGYRFQAVPIAGCLHLKSAVTPVAANTLLVNPAWVAKSEFADLDFIDVDPTEPSAANALLIGDAVVYQPSYPRTFERLAKAGLRVMPVDMSELAKAEGALTCCSLIFKA